MAQIDSANLAKAIDKSGYTPTQLAQETHVSLSYICDIIAGRRTLKRNPELRHAIAKALDVPYSWIESDVKAS